MNGKFKQWWSTKQTIFSHIKSFNTKRPRQMTLEIHVLTWDKHKQNRLMRPPFDNWIFNYYEVPSWSWSYDSGIYNYLCNKCLSPLALWVRIPLRRGVLNTALCDKVCQWLAAGRWFSPGTPVSSTNKSDRHDITEIWLKVALITIALTPLNCDADINKR